MLQNLRFFFRIHRKQLRTAGIFFLLGLAYYIVTQLTPLRIPCLFQKVTGLACPGCGILVPNQALYQTELHLETAVICFIR